MTHRLPKTVNLVEVGPRDGFQAEAKFIPTELKARLIEGLADAGFRHIQVASFVRPEWAPQMADAEALCALLNRNPRTSYSGLALNRKGVARAAAADLDAVDVSISTSETHSLKNARMTLAQARAALSAMIADAKDAGLETRASLQSAFGCNYEGTIPESRIVDMAGEILEQGVDLLSLADSTGRADPLSVKRLVNAIAPLAGTTPIGLHLHDTRGLGLANVTAALERGVAWFDAAFAGMGGCPYIPGATGNISSEDTLNLMTALGVETGVDIEKVAACSDRIEGFLEKQFPGKMHRLIRARKQRAAQV